MTGTSSAVTRGPRGTYAKTAQRREEIVAVAQTVLSERGFHGASMREIAQQAGISVTTLMHHYPTKPDLLRAVLERNDDEGYELADSLDQVGVVATVLRIVERNLHRPEMLRLLAVLSAEATAPDHPAHGWFVHRYDELIDGIATYIAQDRQSGRLRGSLEPTRAAHLIAAVWDGLQLQWLLNPRIDMRARMVDALEEILQPAGASLPDLPPLNDSASL